MSKAACSAAYSVTEEKDMSLRQPVRLKAKLCSQRQGRWIFVSFFARKHYHVVGKQSCVCAYTFIPWQNHTDKPKREKK